jgi:hypothetical protein
MDKGIRKADAEYFNWINSGDQLVSDSSFMGHLAESKACICSRGV